MLKIKSSQTKQKKKKTSEQNTKKNYFEKKRRNRVQEEEKKKILTSHRMVFQKNLIEKFHRADSFLFFCVGSQNTKNPGKKKENKNKNKHPSTHGYMTKCKVGIADLNIIKAI